MAAAKLAITRDRERVVDFVKLQGFGMIPLIRKPSMNRVDDIRPFNFSVFKPLAPEVWGLCLIAMVMVYYFDLFFLFYIQSDNWINDAK